MTTTYWTSVDSPLGTLWLTGDDIGITGLFMTQPDLDGVEDPTRFTAAREQLELYFMGELHEFDLPLHLVGTPFQQDVWAALRDIPYGEVRSYQEIAEQIGRPTASRAVGAANGRNPIAVIVPCHRVVGSSGSLTGYAWGTERKQALLELELSGLDGDQQALPAPAVMP